MPMPGGHAWRIRSLPERYINKPGHSATRPRLASATPQKTMQRKGTRTLESGKSSSTEIHFQTPEQQPPCNTLMPWHALGADGGLCLLNHPTTTHFTCFNRPL